MHLKRKEMIPIRIHYTEEVKENYWKRIKPLLTRKKEVILNDFIKHNQKFSEVKDAKGLILSDFSKIKSCIKSLELGEPKGFDFMVAKYNTFVNNKDLYCNASLIDDLGITVCPYCNRSFIMSTRVGVDNKIKSTCQLDHFYNKDQYPIFALSLQNLIPVCSSCNQSKGTEPFGLSPFEIEDVDKGFKFSLEYTKADYTKPEAFKVVTKTPDTALYEQRLTLGLDKLYERHNDIGHELFLKQHIYSEDRIRELCESFPELFNSPNEVRQLVLGNYIDKKDVGKRPLAKMTRDIMLQLKFIEE